MPIPTMEDNEKPRLVSSSQGFSVLNTIQYKGKFLYSKYNPSRAIESLVDGLDILNGTLVIIFSPCLWYGLEKLLEKLPHDCPILALENDLELFNLAKAELEKSGRKESIVFYNLKDSSKIEEYLKTLLSTGKIKRSLRLDFSAGTSFNRELYDYTALAIQDIIGTFWKNRITLVKMGRLFSKNFIRNLRFLDDGLILNDVEKTVSKKILVLGAGEGLDSIHIENLNRQDFYIICVDASLIPLLDRNIIPDAVVAMESQFAIQKAYIGIDEKIKGKSISFFADLSSRHELIDNFDGKKIFFASRYADGKFFDRLITKGILKEYINPMGSVGLAAVYIALKLRTDTNVEIYTAGLDFSYSIGATHAKATMAHKQRLLTNSRMTPVENFDAAFSTASQFLLDKNNRKIVSTKNLESYGRQFSMFFGNEKNLFDCSSTGINLGIEQKSLSTEKSHNEKEISKDHELFKNFSTRNELKLAGNFLKEEKKQLETARDLLINGENSTLYDGKDIKTQLKNLLSARNYLFLHFPDGYCLNMDLAFLKRVRAEIDYFLKLLKNI